MYNSIFFFLSSSCNIFSVMTTASVFSTANLWVDAREIKGGGKVVTAEFIFLAISNNLSPSQGSSTVSTAPIVETLHPLQPVHPIFQPPHKYMRWC